VVVAYDREGMACNGCKHLHYSKPDGNGVWFRWKHIQEERWEIPAGPHIWCRFFNFPVKAIVELVVGCDGHKNKNIVRHEIPPGCPTVEALRAESRQGFFWN